MKRMDTGEEIIIDIKKEELSETTVRENNLSWEGSNVKSYNANLLGIYSEKFSKSNLTDSAPVIINKAQGKCSGYGFGYKEGKGDAQGYCWNGKSIPKTVFQISVK